MSRPLRIALPDTWYHVMNRGRNGEAIFSSPADFAAFVALLKESAEQWHVRFGAYRQMPSHYLCGAPRKLIQILHREVWLAISRVFGMSVFISTSSAIERIKARLETNEELRQHVSIIRREIVEEKSQTET